jgi:hypothetical protein
MAEEKMKNKDLALGLGTIILVIVVMLSPSVIWLSVTNHKLHTILKSKDYNDAKKTQEHIDGKAFNEDRFRKGYLYDHKKGGLRTQQVSASIFLALSLMGIGVTVFGPSTF